MTTAMREDAPLYNSRITNTYLRYVRAHYPRLDIADLLQHAGMEPGEIEDEGHWFTQLQVNRFQERLRQLTGNLDIAREAGRSTASPETLGSIGRYLLGLISPARAYALCGYATNKLTRSSHYESRPVGPNTVEIVVTPHPGVREEPFQCQNRHGFIEAISGLFNLRPPRIEHPECLFTGHKRCRYLVSWQPSVLARWRRFRSFALPVLGALAMAAVAGFLPGAPPQALIPAAIAVYLGLSWRVARLEARELAAAVKTLERTSDDLMEQQRINHEHALMINEIGQRLNRKSNIEEILTSVVEILQRRLDFDRGLILLSNPDKTRLLIKGGYGYDAQKMEVLLHDGGFALNRESSRGIFVICYKEKRPFLVNNLDEIRSSLSARSLALAEAMGAQSFICCPIHYEEEPLGVVAVDNVRSKRPLVVSDMNLLMGIAPQIAVCIHNIRLNERRLRQFQSILQVLVASTEARDPITAGHSLKVTQYAVGICRQLEQPTDYTDMIRVAASLHDYGKIGLYDSLLKKPEPLTPEEHNQVKAHVVKTREILAQVNFEGIYREVPAIAGAHHEKLDGSGYPAGLVGDLIPFGAKILAVADVFEALTSKRHYRDPMPLEEAFDELVANVGRHFDESCVQALIEYYRTQVAPTNYRYEEARRRLRDREESLRELRISF